MGTRPDPEHAIAIGRRLEAELPRPTAGYRRRAWLAFQLALGRKQCLGSRFEFSSTVSTGRFRRMPGKARHPDGRHRKQCLRPLRRVQL
jgi:hypothetical protein